MAGVFSFLAMWIFLPLGISFLPEKYAGCETPVRILMIGAFSNMATGLNSILVFYDKKVKNGVILMSFMLVFQFGISFYLTKDYGIVGICWATSITILSFNLLKAIIIWYSYRLFPFNFHYLFIFLFLCLMISFHEFLDVDLVILQVMEFVGFSGLIYFLVKRFNFVEGIDSILSGIRKNESK
jgi:O-antigen/teichoic acid export membrane protein